MPEQKAPAKKPTAEKAVKERGGGWQALPRPQVQAAGSCQGTAASNYIGWRREKVAASSATRCAARKAAASRPVLAGRCAEHKKGAEAAAAAAPATPATPATS